MTEQPRIVTRTRRTAEPIERRLPFTAEMIPAQPEVLGSYRHEAWREYERHPMPTTSDEAWRRTDLRGLDTDSFVLPGAGAHLDLPPLPERLLQPVADTAHGGEVILMPGGATTRLDSDLAAQGVVFTDFETAGRDHADLLARLAGKVVKPSEGKFAALSAALGTTGVLLYIPSGVKVIQPLHSLLWGPGVRMAHLSHVIVWLEEGAEATYVHEYASPDEQGGQTLHSGIVEVRVGQGASLRFVELQSWGRNVWNITHERARVEANGTLEWVFGAIGSGLTKNFSDLDLAGQGSEIGRAHV